MPTAPAEAPAQAEEEKQEKTIEERLDKLKELLEKKYITKEEFQERRKKILDEEVGP